MGRSSFYDRLTIRNRLIVFCLVPIASVFALGVGSIYQQHLRYVDAVQVSEFAVVSATLIDLTRSLHKENSFSRRFSADRTEANRNMMQAQRRQTNAAIETFSLELERRDPGHVYWGLRNEFMLLIIGLQSLNATRAAIDVAHINPVEYFTELNTGIIDILRYLVVLSRDVPLARTSDEMITLLALEALAWQESDLVASVIVRGEINADEFQMISASIAEQRTLLKNYLGSMDLLQQQLQQPDIREIEVFRDQVIDGAISQATRRSQLKELRALVGTRRALLRGSVRDKAELDALARQAMQLLGLLQANPAIDSAGRQALERIAFEFAGEGTDRVTADDQQTLDLISMLETGQHMIPIGDWRERTQRRIQIIEAATLVTRHKLMSRSRVIMAEGRRTLRQYALLSLMLLLISTYLAYRLMNRFVGDIKSISDSMQQMSAAGEFDRVLTVTGDDEIAEMAYAFNTLSADRHIAERKHLSIKTRLLEIEQQHNQQLEARVVERTRELELARQEAELASEAKSRFLGNMTHHFRTPLNAILGFGQMLLSDTGFAPEQKRQIQVIIDNGAGLNRLVDDVLLLVDLESGKPQIEEVSFRPVELMQSVITEFSESAAANSLDLHVSVDDKVPDTLLGDEAKIRKVLFELVANSISFTDSGRVSVDMTSAGDNRYLLAVEDTGCGMSEEKFRSLLGNFEQVTDGCDSGDGGLGMGLSIADKLARLMGGKLTPSQPPGGGLRIEMAFTWDHLNKQAAQITPETGCKDERPEAAGSRHTTVQLPGALVDDFLTALEAADYLTLMEITDVVRGFDEGLGYEVQALVSGYEYEELKTLITACA